jgi:PAS domain S-box-containing protein
MSTVSCRLSAALLAAAAAGGLSRQRLLAGVKTPPEVLTAAREWMPWTDFVRLAENFVVLVGGLRAALRFAVELPPNPATYQRLRRLHAAQPVPLYRRLVERYARRVLPALEFRHEALPRRRCRVTVTLPRDGPPSDAVLALIGAALAQWPRRLALAPARVTTRFDGRKAEYRITPPAGFPQSAPLPRTSARRAAGSAHVARLRTQRARLESRLQILEREARDFRGALEAISDGVVVHRAGQVLYANPAMACILGVPRAGVLAGVPLARWVSPTDAADLGALLMEGVAAKRLDVRFRTGQGRDTLLELTLLPHIVWNGIPAGLVVARDVTERRALERALAQSSQREQQRLANDLHDGLGQHLTAIALKAKVLEGILEKRGSAVAPVAAELASLAAEAAGQARDLAHAVAPIDINPLGFGHALHHLAVTTARLFGIECRFDAEHAVVELPGDGAMQLYRAIQEALTNALQHGNAREVRIELRQPPGRLQVVVTDNGCGFDPHTLVRDRTGTGLRIMRHRVESLGGALTIAPARPHGTQVTFDIPVVRGPLQRGPAAPPRRGNGPGAGGDLLARLAADIAGRGPSTTATPNQLPAPDEPLSEAAADAEAGVPDFGAMLGEAPAPLASHGSTTPGAGSTPPLRRLDRGRPQNAAPWRVLVVDESPMVRAGLRALFSFAGSFVVCAEAATLEEALRLCGTEHPDVVVTDVLLGDTTTMPLIRELREREPGVRIVVYSSFSDRLYGAAAHQAGADDYVAKQAAPAELLVALRRVVGGEA